MTASVLSQTPSMVQIIPMVGVILPSGILIKWGISSFSTGMSLYL